MRKTLIAFSLVLMLGGCQALGLSENPRDQLLTACEGFNSARIAATGFLAAGSFTQTQVDRFELAEQTVRPVCINLDTVTDFDTALAVVQEELLRMQLMNAQAAEDINAS